MKGIVMLSLVGFVSEKDGFRVLPSQYLRTEISHDSCLPLRRSASAALGGIAGGLEEFQLSGVVKVPRGNETSV